MCLLLCQFFGIPLEWIVGIEILTLQMYWAHQKDTPEIVQSYQYQNAQRALLISSGTSGAITSMKNHFKRLMTSAQFYRDQSHLHLLYSNAGDSNAGEFQLSLMCCQEVKERYIFSQGADFSAQQFHPL